MIRKSKTFLAIFAFGALFLGSCVSTKDTVYFGNIPADNPKIRLPEYQEPIVQVDDILHITIQTLDGGTTTAINRLSGGSDDSGNPAPVTNNNTPNGYLVDEEGKVTLPMLGTLQVAGLTTSEVRALIHKQAA